MEILNKNSFADLSTIIIEWYQNNNRDLSIRETLNPYNIWLSEVILQQTRMDQGLPYYDKFIRTFPTIQSLAISSEQEVLRLWQGLGYYSRARNLHKCAKIIVNQYGGKFPESSEALEKLPGIGPYTAAAIASFAFNEPVVAVDGNVLRIFTRLFGIEEDIRKNKTISEVRQLAQQFIDDNRPGIYNHALMDFGSIVCKPVPCCQDCPFTFKCEAFSQKRQNELPYKSSPAKQKHRFFHYLFIENENKFLMNKREKGDIWTNLYDFPLIESDRALDPDEMEDSLLDRLTIDRIELVNNYKHVLSHQIIHARFIHVLTSQSHMTDFPALTYFSLEEMIDLPKPVLIDNFLSDYFKSSL